MKKIIFIALFAFVFAQFNVNAQEAEKIQIAILLDTSSSMDGLIDQAKANLWKIINETARAKKGGKTPHLEVSLFEYGNDGLKAKEGYIRCIVPLTDDLDRISDELFKLKTNGGDEYCGMVISDASKKLGWSGDNGMLKVIYIAGNEPFSQGSVDYKGSVKNSLKKGIIVNTIYCGDYQTGINEGWKDGADRGEGTYSNIDQNERIVDIKAPQDDEILKLNGELNKTYIAYGAGGKQKKEMQEKQDVFSASIANDTAVQRTMTKSASAYKNSGWDLVDAQKDSPETVSTMKEEDLPVEMKKMGEKERIAYVEKKGKERSVIQEKIKKLSVERQAYVDKEMKKNAKDNTLDSAIVKTIRSQAVKKGYRFE
jgi:hypothetical protein